MSTHYRTLLGILFLVALAAAQPACTLEEDFLTTPGTQVSFSTDTLRFDTVFAAVGSATRSFKIYNSNDRPLSLKTVQLVDGLGGRFRINVDGVAASEHSDVFIPANDSIYVFVEVTVDPTLDPTASPFIFSGQVLVTAVDETQVVELEAFGQDAVYLPADRSRAGFVFLACDMGEIVFDDPRPYVLYGSLVVDSCTLTLPAGARLYVHGGLVRNDIFTNPVYNDGLIIVQGSGKLNIAGTLEAPVLIASDRLEDDFLRRAGQYSGIRLGAGTGPHTISHARIRNGIVGIYADSASVTAIDHTEISYVGSAGVVGYQADMRLSNVAIHSTGSSALQAVKGGTLRMDYVTLASYDSRDVAMFMSNFTEFPRQSGQFLVAPLDARVRNSIVYGSQTDALALGNISPVIGQDVGFNYRFEQLVLRENLLLDSVPEFAEQCVNCLYPDPRDPLFLNVAQDTFTLDSLSVARRSGLPIEVTVDLLGNPRAVDSTDIGAYEWQPRH